MQKNWTFQYISNNNLHLYSKYLLSIGIIFLLNNVLLIFFVEQIHLGEIQAKFFQIILCSIAGYSIQKTFVFTKQDTNPKEFILIFHEIMTGKNCINFKGIKFSRDPPIHLRNISRLFKRDDF